MCSLVIVATRTNKHFVCDCYVLFYGYIYKIPPSCFHSFCELVNSIHPYRTRQSWQLTTISMHVILSCCLETFLRTSIFLVIWFYFYFQKVPFYFYGVPLSISLSF